MRWFYSEYYICRGLVLRAPDDTAGSNRHSQQVVVIEPCSYGEQQLSLRVAHSALGERVGVFSSSERMSDTLKTRQYGFGLA